MRPPPPFPKITQWSRATSDITQSSSLFKVNRYLFSPSSLAPGNRHSLFQSFPEKLFGLEPVKYFRATIALGYHRDRMRTYIARALRSMNCYIIMSFFYVTGQELLFFLLVFNVILCHRAIAYFNIYSQNKLLNVSSLERWNFLNRWTPTK